MFTTNSTFLAWLELHGVGQVYEKTEGMPDHLIAAIKGIYEEVDASIQNLDMLQLSGSLGKAAPRIIDVVRKEEQYLTNRETLRSFAVDHTVTVYRLIDIGIAGDANRLANASDPMLTGMIPLGHLEDDFIRPMTEQIVDQALSIFNG